MFPVSSYKHEKENRIAIAMISSTNRLRVSKNGGRPKIFERNPSDNQLFDNDSLNILHFNLQRHNNYYTYSDLRLVWEGVYHDFFLVSKMLTDTLSTIYQEVLWSILARTPLCPPLVTALIVEFLLCSRSSPDGHREFLLSNVDSLVQSGSSYLWSLRLVTSVKGEWAKTVFEIQALRKDLDAQKIAMPIDWSCDYWSSIVKNEELSVKKGASFAEESDDHTRNCNLSRCLLF